MNTYAPGSNERVLWRCPKNPNHIWKRSINKMVSGQTGCKRCIKNYSNAQIKWLTEIENKENIDIQHATKPNGEFNIQGVGCVDGYCAQTNTIYEFHGDFWHGNPRIYNRDDINPINHKTYGDLYDKTIKRDEKIRQLGYNLIVKWETDLPTITKESPVVKLLLNNNPTPENIIQK
jgi:hypothetical protein